MLTDVLQVWEVGLTSWGGLDAKLETIYHKTPYIAPSWSWASRFGEYFEFRCPRDYFIPGTPPQYMGKNNIAAHLSAPNHMKSEITFVDYNAELEGHNPYGRIKNACLTLHGKLIPLPSDITLIPRVGRNHFGYFGNKLGTVALDWSVSKKTVVKKTVGLKLLLTASCCQATSNEPLKYFAHPEEDHSTTFTEEPPPEIELTESDGCCDESKDKNAWGIVLHPGQKPGTYVRVGMFVLFGGSWGTSRIFRDIAHSEVKLV